MPEILGFSPQLLLDDIINEANESIVECVDAVEVFLERWAKSRAERLGGNWDGFVEIEQVRIYSNGLLSSTKDDAFQGMNSFQMMLESYTDIAFDVFEVWSLRNIFAINPGLKVVAPHHKGLNLETRAEDETALMSDIEDLRQKIDNVRIHAKSFSSK